MLSIHSIRPDFARLWKTRQGQRPTSFIIRGAEGGNYKVLDRRPCRFVSATKASCDIKVRDDLVPALKIGFDVTDTFHLTFEDGLIVSVVTSSDDPPVFKAALEWIGKERPEVMDGACKGFFDGGPTPQACVREVVKGFTDYAALKKH